MKKVISDRELQHLFLKIIRDARKSILLKTDVHHGDMASWAQDFEGELRLLNNDRLTLKALIHVKGAQKKFYEDPHDNLAYIEQLANAGWDIRKDSQDSLIFAEKLAGAGWDVRLNMDSIGPRALLVDGGTAILQHMDGHVHGLGPVPWFIDDDFNLRWYGIDSESLDKWWQHSDVLEPLYVSRREETDATSGILVISGQIWEDIILSLSRQPEHLFQLSPRKLRS